MKANFHDEKSSRYLMPETKSTVKRCFKILARRENKYMLDSIYCGLTLTKHQAPMKATHSLSPAIGGQRREKLMKGYELR